MSLNNLYDNILSKPPSNPLPNYLFRVVFQCNDGLSNDKKYVLDNDKNRSMIAIQIDLPSFETNIVTKKFLGSEKSFPIYRKNSGDTTLAFYAHAEQKDNDFIIYNFFKKIQEKYNGKYWHYENYNFFDNICIWLCSPNKEFQYVYHLINCTVTKIDQGQLSYEGSEAIKYTMSVHYDDWYIEEIT